MPTNKHMTASAAATETERIVIDPITRIEGHLKIETEISNGQVIDAWSSGTLFRGIETILQGREPTDAWLFTQRLCGVCTYVHGASSVRCVEDVDLNQISEDVRHSWYAGSSLHPSQGETNPNYTGYNTADEYSWLKAPRYQGEPMEVGPLARILVAYGKNNEQIKTVVDEFLSATDLTAEDLHSTLGRTAARALETKVIADEMDLWLDQLVEGAGTRVSVDMPLQAVGAGLNEAPRGALGHWITIDNKKIENYQMVVPSTWNLGPRCSAGKEGPVEAALGGTPVVDSSMPLEILRTVHSFDPCMACAVHVIDRKADKIYDVKVI